MNRRHDDDPVLITEAQVSFDDEFTTRKRRYSIIMACRIPCLLLAGVFGIWFGRPDGGAAHRAVGAAAMGRGADRQRPAPKKSRKVNRYQANRQALPEVSEAQIIEAAEVLDARSHRTDGTRQARQDAPGHEPPRYEQAPPRTGTDG